MENWLKSVEKSIGEIFQAIEKNYPAIRQAKPSKNKPNPMALGENISGIGYEEAT